MQVFCHRIRFAWEIAALVVSLACLSAGQQPDIQNLVTSGNLELMRWPNFNDYRDSLQKFYGRRDTLLPGSRDRNPFRRRCR